MSLKFKLCLETLSLLVFVISCYVVLFYWNFVLLIWFSFDISYRLSNLLSLWFSSCDFLLVGMDENSDYFKQYLIENM
jgi:hypothetical protein